MIEGKKVQPIEEKGNIPKPFPFFPPTPTETLLVRMELMQDLNKWEVNNPKIAKDVAASLIELLAEQFELDLHNW